MRLSNILRSVLIARISVLIKLISSVFLPIISNMPATLFRNSSTLSLRADRPSPNILKSECNASRMTANSLSLFMLDSLFFITISFVFFECTTMIINCQGTKGQEIMTGWKVIK